MVKRQTLSADGCEYVYWRLEASEGVEVFVQFPPEQSWHRLQGATDTDGVQGYRLLCAGPKVEQVPEGAVVLPLGHNPSRIRVTSTAETVLRPARRVTVVSPPGTGPGSIPPGGGSDWVEYSQRAAASAEAASISASAALIERESAEQAASGAASAVEAAFAAANREVVVQGTPSGVLVVPDIWDGWMLREVRVVAEYESPDGTPHPADILRYATEDDYDSGITPDTVATISLGPAPDPAAYRTRTTLDIGQVLIAGQVFTANVARSWWKLRPAV